MNGAGHATVVEPRTAMREYAFQWGKAKIDQAELARLSLVEKWPLERLQTRFGYRRTKIVKELKALRLWEQNGS